MKKLLLLFGLFLGLGGVAFAAAGYEYSDPDVNLAMNKYGNEMLTQDLVNYCDTSKSKDFYEKLLLRLAELIPGELNIVNEGIPALSFSRNHINKFDGFLTAKKSIFGVSMIPQKGAFIRALTVAIERVRERKADSEDDDGWDEVFEQIDTLNDEVNEQKEEARSRQIAEDEALARSLQEGREPEFAAGGSHQLTGKTGGWPLKSYPKRPDLTTSINEASEGEKDKEEIEAEDSDDAKIATLRNKIQRLREKVAVSKRILESGMQGGPHFKDERQADLLQRELNQLIYEKLLHQGFTILSTQFEHGEAPITNSNDLIRKMNRIGDQFF